MHGMGDTALHKSSHSHCYGIPSQGWRWMEEKMVDHIIPEAYEYYTNTMGWQEENNQDGSVVDFLVGGESQEVFSFRRWV